MIWCHTLGAKPNHRIIELSLVLMYHSWIVKVRDALARRIICPWSAWCAIRLRDGARAQALMSSVLWVDSFHIIANIGAGIVFTRLRMRGALPWWSDGWKLKWSYMVILTISGISGIIRVWHARLLGLWLLRLKCSDWRRLRECQGSNFPPLSIWKTLEKTHISIFQCCSARWDKTVSCWGCSGFFS